MSKSSSSKLALLGSSLALAFITMAAQPARAEVTIGVILATTGPAASLGILEKNGVALAAEGAREKFRLVYLDDTSDPSEAVRAATKLISEQKADAIIGTTTTPAAAALTGVAAENRTPVLSQAPSNAIVQPVDAQRRWIFKTTTNDEHEANPLLAHMNANGVRNLAFIGFSDAYGEQWLQMIKRLAPEKQITLADEERFARTDTSVASQVLKIMSKPSDAVLIAGSGGAAATPLLELRKRGYQGKIYVTLGATFGDFLKLSGPQADGIYAPFAAVMDVNQLADSDPAKAGAKAFVEAYERKYGSGSSNIFSAGAWDAVRLVDAAVPVALKAGQPGTPEFREALRSAIEGLRNQPGARGVYNMSATDHAGLDSKALRVGRFEKGRWMLQD